ncbi:hypothetical protein HPB51_025473 [Rhipicephalus microplus]|uniref:Uncharacterized protein n=1 Tax=Rhipicephalus microplus TaxID=6941 RepID=A0A9J6DRS1_RHIMP|nr:hypothetical protein HPB51_025473 [Rhipicephalus microplus]
MVVEIRDCVFRSVTWLVCMQRRPCLRMLLVDLALRQSSVSAGIYVCLLGRKLGVVCLSRSHLNSSSSLPPVPFFFIRTLCKGKCGVPSRVLSGCNNAARAIRAVTLDWVDFGSVGGGRVQRRRKKFGSRQLALPPWRRPSVLAHSSGLSPEGSPLCLRSPRSVGEGDQARCEHIDLVATPHPLLFDVTRWESR